jgi:hypothetical protein
VGTQPAPFVLWFTFCVARACPERSRRGHRPRNPPTKFEIKGRRVWRKPAHATFMTEKSAASKKPLRKRRSIGRSARYTKRKGTMAELIFVVKATSMGFAREQALRRLRALRRDHRGKRPRVSHSGEIGFHDEPVGIHRYRGSARLSRTERSIFRRGDRFHRGLRRCS